MGKPGGEDGTGRDAVGEEGEVDLVGVVGVGEGGGERGRERGGEDTGVPEGERDPVLGAPDEVQSNSRSSADPESLFSSLTPATVSTSRQLLRSRITLALNGKFPEARPSWMVCTVMATLPRILSLFPA